MMDSSIPGRRPNAMYRDLSVFNLLLVEEAVFFRRLFNLESIGLHGSEQLRVRG